ncbi:MAG: hypothetical protein IKH19_06965 [Muribaculaceae bacterium]|nr:hypothetical protein [Muribaculaceae bacterium]
MRELIVLMFVACMAVSLAAQEKTNKVSDFMNNLSSRFWFSGYALVDYSYNDQASPSNEFKVNKVVAMVDFTVFPKVHAFAMFHFTSPSLLEAWASYTPCKEFGVKAGQFKTPFSLENPLSPTVLEHIYENGLVTNYMVMGGNPLMMPGSGGRDIGLSIFGNLFNDHLSYDLAIMNGAGRNRGDINSAKDVVARITVHPERHLSLGGSMILGRGYIEGVGNFKRNRFAASAQLKTKPLELRSEYMWGRDGDDDSQGCYVTAAFRNVVRNLDAVAGYDHLDCVNGIINRYSVGLNYWFYHKCRLRVGYNYKKVHGIEKGANSILTQVQVAF